MEQRTGKKDSKSSLHIRGMAVLILIVIILTLNYFKVISLENIFKFTNLFNTREDTNPNRVIARVGEENIYQKDFDAESRTYPSLKNVDTKKLLLDKLSRDSIILQGAQADGIVKLDNSVYNSLRKDYAGRLDLVSSVTKKIESSSDLISGNIISIWFYNRSSGRFGYEKGRELARAAITKLHDDVVAKKLTIQQAAQAIRNDPNLGYVDPAYLSNALLEFANNPSEQIVFDPAFDSRIKKLAPGEVSDVVLAKSRQWDNGSPTSKMIDSVYMFAQVSARKKTSINNFDSWFNQKSKTYAVTYY